MTMNGMKPRNCIEKSEGRLRWEDDQADTVAELKRLSTIRTQGNPYPSDSALPDCHVRATDR